MEEKNVMVVKFNLEGISNLSNYYNRRVDDLMVELSKKYKIKYYKMKVKKIINRFIGSINQIDIKLHNFEIFLINTMIFLTIV